MYPFGFMEELRHFSLLPCQQFADMECGKIFQTLHDNNIAWGLHCHSRFDDLCFVSMSQVCQKYETANCVLWILVLCSLNIVWLLYSYEKDYAQYDLCDSDQSDVYSREMI